MILRLSSLLVFFAVLSLYRTDGGPVEGSSGGHETPESSIPVFRCTEEGKFSDPESCSSYVSCEDFAGVLVPVKHPCRRSRYFDDSEKRCRPLRRVVSPERCTKAYIDAAQNSYSTTPISIDTHDEHITIDNSAIADITGTDNTTTDEFNSEDIIADGNNTAVVDDDRTENYTMTSTTVLPELEISYCDYVNEVDNYNNFVISSLYWDESLEDHDRFNKYIDEYNKPLEAAKNNSEIWNKGHSIWRAMKLTHNLALEFKEKFNRKYGINQNRLKQIGNSGNSANQVVGLQKKIESLKNEEKELQDTMGDTEVPQLRKYLINRIASIQQEIKDKEQEIIWSSIEGKVMQEIVNFLQFVDEDAVEAEKQAKHTIEMLKTFNENIDSEVFRHTVSKFRDDIEIIKNLQTSKYAAITKVNSDTSDIEEQRDKLSSAKDTLNKELDKNYEEFSKVNNEKIELISDYMEKKKILCEKNGIIVDLRANAKTIRERKRMCETLMKKMDVILDTSKQDEQLSTLNETISDLNNEIRQNLNSSSDLRERLVELHNRNPDLLSEAEKIDTELAVFMRHEPDFTAFNEFANSGKESILHIVRELMFIQTEFENINKKFKSLIARASEAQNDEEIKSMASEMKTEMSHFKENIDNLEFPAIMDCINRFKSQ